MEAPEHPGHPPPLSDAVVKWSIFSLISSYNTTMEQISVIKHYEFHYGSVMLELGVALHSLGDKDLEEEK